MSKCTQFHGILCQLLTDMHLYEFVMFSLPLLPAWMQIQLCTMRPESPVMPWLYGLFPNCTSH